MTVLSLILVLSVFSIIGYFFGFRRSRRTVNGNIRKLHSLPSYYGFFVAIWCGIPAFLLLGIWITLEPAIIDSMILDNLPQETREISKDRLSLVMNDIKNLAKGDIVSSTPDPETLEAAALYNRLKATSSVALFTVILSVSAIGLGGGLRFISPAMRARVFVENTIKLIMLACSTVAIFTTIGIVLSVIFEAGRFFKLVPITDFLFGLHWSPQIAIRADQVGASGQFGVIPLIVGTLLITLIAMLVAVPIGLLSAIYLSEYASQRLRTVVKPLLEILAGIPTVVYGFFAALVVAPFFMNTGNKIGIDVSSESALAAGVVMGIMIIPFVSSLSDDVISAVPQSLRHGSLGIGATVFETVLYVLLPAALPGIIGSILLAISRAIGETMIVVMAAGLTANLTGNPLAAVTTITVQIVTGLVGDQEFDNPKTLAAFALGLVLFTLTLFLNIIALYVVRKYREQYE